MGKLYILGICGTFMAGVATLARQAGHAVGGCDDHIYPPMSDYLATQNIIIDSAQDTATAKRCRTADLIVVGNTVKRGHPLLEQMLDEKRPYISGPQWLADKVLRDREVVAVAGTHGKTTVSAMIAWILQESLARQSDEAGFLIGGLPRNFSVPARFGTGKYFVVEADEYDSAFFDKRAKFIHYRPAVCVLNNLEFDHADIFTGIDDIKRQFHHLVRTLPRNGTIICNRLSSSLAEVLAEGCWTPVTYFNCDRGWHGQESTPDHGQFDVYCGTQKHGRVAWPLIGRHNMENALAAIAAAERMGIAPDRAVAALHNFRGVARRLQTHAQINGITIYDDFAHHPTAIAATIQALRSHSKKGRIIALLEPGSYTMRHGLHGDRVEQALRCADAFFIKPTDADGTDIIARIKETVRADDHILIMGNRNTAALRERLRQALTEDCKSKTLVSEDASRHQIV